MKARIIMAKKTKQTERDRSREQRERSNSALDRSRQLRVNADAIVKSDPAQTPCPICGAAAGERCELHSGALRDQSHEVRKEVAKRETAHTGDIKLIEQMSVPTDDLATELAQDADTQRPLPHP